MTGNARAAAPEARVEESSNDTDPQTHAALEERAHHAAAADPGHDARARPTTSPVATDATSGIPCPQATYQHNAETYATREAGDTSRLRTETGRRGAEQAANTPPVPRHGERTERPANLMDLPQPIAVDKRAHP